ncbi:hypothetical protein DICSQDRAFT_156224 [Dichomitus squalens LYAD-421 SS1]|uniref:Autophagy-related protein 11 n=1 Tax=Dichomitus squalens (strain LYAD-421) TaxID=732165 RepID=R7STX9_DICSQ|nr:uncharacterized protein DICSQDRAFT_156224 [Dichomitus squalens LYAD-421 SS1]EJF59536.1 hypothetical protein DICSQDRAFT_156224 [Dichomitus squalens LYAD-421 SS1]
MIQLCRAEDGVVVELDTSLWDLERLDSLDHFIYEKTGVPPEAIWAYLSDGRPLKADNVRELAGLEDQTVYVFNKTYLSSDLEQVLHDLHYEPQLQPLVEDAIASTPPFRISQLASSYVQAALAHVEHINRTLTSLHYQQRALQISSSALDHHVLAISDTFEALAGIAERELDRQAKLLGGLEADLEIVSRVRVHKEFLSAAVRRAMEAGDKGRTLGDYVSRVKMQQVAASCVKTHEELKARFEDVQEAMARLSRGGDEVRHAVGNNSSIEDGEACARRAQELWEKISTLNASVERPGVAPEKALQEFRQLDDALRIEVERIADIKNVYTEQCMYTIRRISELNTDIVAIPSAMSALQASFRAKTSFSHIARLHSMLYAYGATIVEIVRRKEFARFFYQRAQSILEVMAKLSSNERKRRQAYKNEVQGELPFEVKAIDDAVPNIDFSPSGSNDFPYTLERVDIDEFLRVLDDLERFARDAKDPAAEASVQETRSKLDKLIGKMDSLESGFDRIAERSLLSTSRLLSHRRRTTEDEQAYAELQIQLQELHQQKDEQDAVHRQSRAALEAELAELRDSLQMSETARGQLERDLHATRAQLESEATSRRILDERNSEMSKEADAKREALSRALSEATEQTRSAELLRQQLAQVKDEFEAVKALESTNAGKISLLLEEQAKTLRRLEEARARGEDLEAQIQAARGESDDVKRALVEAAKEKDRLLRAQASEHDRLLRDHIAEADGDRAVLEHQFSELRAALEDAERHLKDARAQAEMANADAVGLREELQRVEHELRDARRDERTVREDLRAGRASQADFEHKLEQSERLVAQMLDVALAFRDAHVKALSNVQAMIAHPGSRGAAAANLGDSALSHSRHAIVAHSGEPAPIDPSDPVAALEALRAFDHDHFLEAIAKAGSTIRKWQKQCKDYRERAKGKISFRNFAKGDLALFLPTRNSISKPWAAFNVSFPHYFLQATGHLAEQLKTREWIVARITSITERVVDSKDPNTNPYGLGDGVKYYMLEVEDWTQPSFPSKRRESSKKAPTVEAPLEPTNQLPPATEAIPIPVGPPEPEVEESFSATRPPTSRLFPRNRSASSPTAGPSSLSRLLAQAGPSEPPTSSSPGLGSGSADGRGSSEEALALAPPRDASPTIFATPPDPEIHSPKLPRSVSPTVPLPPPANTSSEPPPQSPAPSPSPTRPSFSPTPGIGSQPVNHHVPNQPSPLRSTSRASRGSGSTSSRFSRGIPFGTATTGSVAAAKTVPTTAISEHAISTLSTTPSSGSGSGASETTLAGVQMPGTLGTSTLPSPEGSPTLGMTSVLTQSHRRRTTSYHLPSSRSSTVGLSSPNATATPSSPLAGVGIGVTASSRLASLASSWGVSFGRRRRSEILESESAGTAGGRAPGGASPIPESPTQAAD